MPGGADIGRKQQRGERRAAALATLIAGLAALALVGAPARAQDTDATSRQQDDEAMRDGADDAGARSPTASAARDRILAAYKEYGERMDAGDKASALGPAKRAYDYAQQDLTVEDEELAITAYALGDLLLELGRPVDALRPLTHALECYERQNGRLSPRSLRAERRIAETNQALGRWETAERTYLDLIARYQQREGDQTTQIAALHSRLTKLMIEAKEPARARRYGLRALNLYKQANGPDSIEVGLLSIQLAHINFDLEEYQDGLELLDYGTPIVERHLPPGDPQLISIYEFLIDVYGKAGDDRRARRYRVRLKKTREAAAEQPADAPPKVDAAS